MPRVRRLFVHFIVENLVVPRPWRVGRTTIRPAGNLLRRLDDHLPVRIGGGLAWVVREYRQELGESEWATIEVPILVAGDRIEEAAIDVAREIGRDTIAVLRLFQRTSIPNWSMEYQTFGLEIDVGSLNEPRWVTDRRGTYAGAGWRRHGVVAPWTFTPAQLRAYRTDARFEYLDAALLAAERVDDWQGRFLTALRTMNIATVRERPATRIMLLATALEALLGDPFVPGGSARGRGHQLARRAAYLACGWGPEPPGLHRPGGRAACAYLTPGRRDPRNDPELYYAPGDVWFCSEYGGMRRLYDDRNAALHGAAASFDQHGAATHQSHLDRVILEGLSWVLERRPGSIRELDDEIASLPAA